MSEDCMHCDDWRSQCNDLMQEIAALRATITQQAQEMERVKLQRDEAMTERKMYESQHGLLFQENLQLRNKLAAMTTERDEQGRLKADLFQRFEEAQRQLIVLVQDSGRYKAVLEEIAEMDGYPLAQEDAQKALKGE